MTPQEKAIQLVESYWEKIIHDDDGDRNDMCKECALLAVELAEEFITGNLDESFDKFLYLQEVKEEIKKL